ncbi:MAG: polysaccharide deacetylase family protein [Streptococcaceae bacterium]|jgi:peptidoglycan/xylan/chitin deacetylase (PgdA/CDA1 family)|nr:polysaccharide deacetylase family protein [Streptococcaceae bacterium]
MKKFLTVIMVGLTIALLTSTITLVAYYTGDNSEVAQKSNKQTKKTTQSSAKQSDDTTEEQVNWTKSEQAIYFPIIAYHQISDTAVDDTTVAISEFKEEMEALKEAGYYTLTPDEAYRVLTTGEVPSDKLIWITFDDGSMESYKNVVPILNELKLKATFNVFTGTQEDDVMSETEWRALKKNSLISLGSQAVDNVDLSLASDVNQSYELSESKKTLDSVLKQDTSVISYPSGKYNEQITSLAESNGYKLGLTTNGGLAAAEDGLYSLSRIEMTAEQTKDTFLTEITPAAWGLS